VLSVAACLVTFTALFVLARMHVFRQRNGGFLAIALVFLLGAIIPLIDRGYELLAGISQQPLAANQAAAPTARPADIEPPLLSQSFALAKPDPAQPQVKVLKDSRVVIGEKPFLIRAGDLFPLLEAKAGEATFAVRDLRVSLPVAVVEILGGKPKETREAAMAAALATVNAAETPKPEPAGNPAKPAQDAAAELAAITRSAQTEAMNRYPALAIKDTRENEAFVAAYRQLKNSGDADFFANPEWPLVLAEQLAARNGWARGDRPAPAAPPSPTDLPPDDTAPANAGPTSPQPPPPNESEPPQIPRAPRR